MSVSGACLSIDLLLGRDIIFQEKTIFGGGTQTWIAVAAVVPYAFFPVSSWKRMRPSLGGVEDGGGKMFLGEAAPLSQWDGTLCVFCLGLLLSLLPDSHAWHGGFLSSSGSSPEPRGYGSGAARA